MQLSAQVGVPLPLLKSHLVQATAIVERNDEIIVAVCNEEGKRYVSEARLGVKTFLK